MAASLGGRRGMVEAAIPGIVFTVTYLVTKDLRTTLIAAGGAAAVAVVLRLVQRQTLQFAMNAVFGIAIGWVFIRLAGAGGGSESDQALAFFLPGILWSTGYSLVLAITCLVRWPMVGFMVGNASEDPLAWHDDPQIVRLCTRLTWLFLAPGAINVCLQAPVWILGHSGALDKDVAIAILGVLRVGVGWAVRAVSWSVMVWVLARDATPIEPRQA
ncbi:DUF3159 domain-containing protein [Nocardioides sp. CBS4Y-1]|uniref:DUF3159 domain-containing protein n=2 Tax=Nocardioides acrostichi TaxID=2784339 RepID=A0A930UVK6_9ACTN|nr:DUF3159 domain-containing protein [Nocardioides acrostichi]